MVFPDDLKKSSTEDDDNQGKEMSSISPGEGSKAKGMILPFQQLTMTFNKINYFVDMPPVGSLFFS